MEKQPERNLLEQAAQSIRKSVTVKIASIFILMLLLMIPMSFIKSLISEREMHREAVISEVSDKWANQQRVYGPILSVPITKIHVLNGKETEVSYLAHFLPGSLEITSSIQPQSLYRGIYEVVVYDSQTNFSGSFIDLENYTEQLDQYDVHWDKAFLTINVSDLRGIKESILVDWNGKEKTVEPGSSIPGLVQSGITVLDILDRAPDSDSLSFSFDLSLQGSQTLEFIPLGKETNAHLSSNWADPSFSGSFLPDTRTVSEEGFEASYKVLELNKNYPQFWIGDRNKESIANSAFGVYLLLPMNDYQKSMRSAKYALLAISLTFLTFFLVEIFNRKEVHPFQYVLIGLALCLFYTLLISISEHFNFNAAYIVSSIAVITMIGLYTKAIMTSLFHTVVLVLILTLTYAFVYITLQVQDYALLIGSIGLTSILALTMFITRKIQWYELGSALKTQNQ